MIRKTVFALSLAALLGAASAQTASAIVRDADGAIIGTAYLESVEGGTRLTVVVEGITPGAHGMHVHEVGSCEASVNAEGQTVLFGGAGSHFDPHAAGSHRGPDAHVHEGHAGDMPNLVADDAGRAVISFVTSRISLTEDELGVLGRALVIHANPDNYTDEPALGGSGGRVACGVITALSL